MKFARIDNGKVAEVIDSSQWPDLVINGIADLDGVFHASFIANLVEIPGGTNVVQGWSYDGVNFSSPPSRSAATEKPIVLQNLAAKRFQVETGGIVHAGHNVDTDRESQTKLIASRTLAKEAKEAAAPYSQDWKTQDGWLTLDADGMIALAEAVLAHVQTAFATEKAKADEINALTTVAALDAYDINSGW